MTGTRQTILLLASASLAILLACGAVWANTFTVNNNRDSGPGSLRAAIVAANARAGADVVTFAPGVRGTIGLRSALPDLRGQIVVRGPGAAT